MTMVGVHEASDDVDVAGGDSIGIVKLIGGVSDPLTRTGHGEDPVHVGGATGQLGCTDVTIAPTVRKWRLESGRTTAWRERT
jgi:hypothetical protein